ncbi:hypothetical protein PIB30_028979 [Stylosanthes scabra]|uniref:Uncharacterized protein n=1 Tax=Stylosanthes scabra TaxID=79078 RepID=A0ABU6VDA3_9FABA|nr:hypothetical protein [Stylosanthes scabra]
MTEAKTIWRRCGFEDMLALRDNKTILGRVGYTDPFQFMESQRSLQTVTLPAKYSYVRGLSPVWDATAKKLVEAAVLRRLRGSCLQQGGAFTVSAFIHVAPFHKPPSRKRRLPLQRLQGEAYVKLAKRVSAS